MSGYLLKHGTKGNDSSHDSCYDKAFLCFLGKLDVKYLFHNRKFLKGLSLTFRFFSGDWVGILMAKGLFCLRWLVK